MLPFQTIEDQQRLDAAVSLLTSCSARVSSARASSNKVEFSGEPMPVLSKSWIRCILSRPRSYQHSRMIIAFVGSLFLAID